MQVSRLNRLDSWRAICCLGVLWIHCWHINSSIPINLFGLNVAKLLSIFGNGVDFFFVISGFSIYYFKQKIFTDFNFKNYFSFLINRFVRIAPAFYLALSVYLFLYSSHFSNLIKVILVNLSFNQTLIPGCIISDHFWTISIEWQFYLLIPIVFYYYISKNILKRIIIFSSIMSVLGMLLLIYDVNLDLQLPVRFTEFSAGLLLAYVYRQNKFDGKRSILLLIVGFALLFMGKLFNTHEALNYVNSSIYYSIIKIMGYTLLTLGFAIILFNTISNESVYFKFLTWKPLIYIGEISFSFYLWHGIVCYYVFSVMSNFSGINPILSLFMQFIICIILTIPISHLSYRYIESKFKWSRLK